MEELLRAIVLGIVQGLTEFIPVSSSGHLILVPALFNWPDQGLAFDVGLHVGTLAALLVYFHRDWLRMASAGLTDLGRHRLAVGVYSHDSQFLLLLALGTVPAAVTGLLFEDWIEENVREPWIVALALVGAGVVMLVADRAARRDRNIDGVNWRDAVIIGCAQAVALIPGVSRSGATITAGLFRNLDGPDAARFAFLLGTPVFAGAAILTLPDLFSADDVDRVDIFVGMAVSATVGLAAIRFLLFYLQRGGLMPFVIYRFGVAAITFIVAGVRTL